MAKSPRPWETTFVSATRPSLIKEAKDQGLIQGMSEDCAGPHYLVGDEVTVFDPDNEPSRIAVVRPGSHLSPAEDRNSDWPVSEGRGGRRRAGP